MDWKKFFDSLGLNGTQWQWRIIRWQNRWENFTANLWGKKQVVSYQHKFCRECGGLLDRDETECPKCGTKAESWRKQSCSRMVGLIMPRACIATPCLLVFNIGVIIVMIRLYGIPMLLNPTTEALFAMGGFLPPAFLSGAWWEIITYGFNHGGMMHIAFNMIALSQVGPLLEDELGTARFYSVYMITLVAAMAPHLILHANAVILVVGASGALFGLIGFGITYCHFSGGFLRSTYRGFFIKWSIYGFLFGIAFHADNFAHLGGLIAGAVLGFLVERERANRSRFTPFWKLLSTFWVIATIAAFVGLYAANTASQ